MYLNSKPLLMSKIIFKLILNGIITVISTLIRFRFSFFEYRPIGWLYE